MVRCQPVTGIQIKVLVESDNCFVMSAEICKGKTLVVVDICIVFLDAQGFVKGLDRFAVHTEGCECPPLVKERFGTGRVDLQGAVEDLDRVFEFFHLPRAAPFGMEGWDMQRLERKRLVVGIDRFRGAPEGIERLGTGIQGIEIIGPDRTA